MHQDEIKVNDLKLPPGLVSAIRQGDWERLASSSSLTAVFGSEPVRPRFFSLQEIAAVNGYWKDETDPLYLGREDPFRYPGDIDPRQSLIIGELGPDQMIALDYRRAPMPEVIFASDDARSPWRLVSGSIEELLSELTKSG